MKNTDSSFIKKHSFIIVFILLYFVLVSVKIGLSNTPFYDWDESIYAQVGREMIRDKSILVPIWQGKPWLDKPPIPSLFYGIIQLLPVSPEISTRIATLFLSCIVLSLLYILSYRITKDKLTSLLTIIITAFLPIFFQRSQALNVDVFLLLGWLGYIIWYHHIGLGSFFLVLAVLSKSLLGFFPPVIFFLYYLFAFITKQITLKQLKKLMWKTSVQVGISSLWFIYMYIVYRYPFIRYQFLDSHFKRVTASIEQHFGQRTFYITVLIDQFKLLLIPGFLSFLYLVFIFFKKKRKQYDILLSLFFLPWFIFLNLTKTKIEWYIYPVLPQFAFLASYPLYLLKKHAPLQIFLLLLLTSVYFLSITPVNKLFTQSFSSWEDHQLIALDAKKNRCRYLQVLVGEDTRTSYATLKSMDLVISTTTWWGNHPSIAYYADIKTSYLYSTEEARNQLDKLNPGGCLIVEKKDVSQFKNIKNEYKKLGTNTTYLLIKAD
ncbi:MAG: hypothetical protein WC489_01895 [Patescibacteria group bacterium]